MASTTDPKPSSPRDDAERAEPETPPTRDAAADAAEAASPPSTAPAASAPRRDGSALARQTPWLVAGVVLLGVALTGLRFGAPALVLFLAFATLAGAILLFWESVRAVLDPNAPGDEVALEGIGQVPSDLEVRKRAALRALKDIEFEHSIHRLSDEDYTVLRERYRAEARAAMEAIDRALGAYLPRAEALIAKAARGEALDLGDAAATDAGEPRAKKNKRKAARAAAQGASTEAAPPASASAEEPAAPRAAAADAEPASESESPTTAAPPASAAAQAPAETPTLAASGADAKPADAKPPSEPASAEPATARRACAACGTSNEPDATFCKRCGAKVGEG